MKVILPVLAALFIGAIIGWKLVGCPAELNGRQIIIIGLIMMFALTYTFMQISQDLDISEKLRK